MKQHKLFIHPVLRLMVLMGFITLSSSLTAQNVSGNSSISGNVKLPKLDKGISKGNNYNNSTDVMHSNDPMAAPDRNVIVSLHPLDRDMTVWPLKDAYITQKEQTFIPHVLPITPGTKVFFLNEDQFFHNVYSATPRSRFNIGRRAPGNAYGQIIKKPGIISLNCDIHAHMKGFVLCLNTNFFTRIDAYGNYNLDNIPSGKYRLECFHAEFGNKTMTIVVTEKANLIQNIDLSR
ncbi:MAG: hypothetical protein AAFO07_21950 [Bacteroidota bacterium]